MIIPNIEALSLSELQFIARKHGIEGTDQLPEDELREALHDFFDEYGTEYTSMSALYSPSNQKRYFNQVYESAEDFPVGTLPGVQDLPPIYNETAIHLILKDPSWAHAYWSIGPNEYTKLSSESQTLSFFLRVCMYSLENEELIDSFDIPVSRDDISWNVNLPEKGRRYRVSLHYQYDDDETGVLSHSNLIETQVGYFQSNVSRLVEDEDRFFLLFSSLVTKGGVLVDSHPIQELFSTIEKRTDA